MGIGHVVAPRRRGRLHLAPGSGRGGREPRHRDLPADGRRTLVSLVHGGWEAFADPAAARAEYDGGWAMVLDRYATAAVGAVS